MKIKVFFINILGLITVITPFIMPIALTSMGLKLSKSNNILEINSNYLKKISVNEARRMYFK